MVLRVGVEGGRRLPVGVLGAGVEAGGDITLGSRVELAAAVGMLVGKGVEVGLVIGIASGVTCTVEVTVGLPPGGGSEVPMSTGPDPSVHAAVSSDAVAKAIKSFHRLIKPKSTVEPNVS